MKDEVLPPGDGSLPWQRRCCGLGASTLLRSGQPVHWLGHQLSPNLAGTPGQEQDVGTQWGSKRCPLLRATLGQWSQGAEGGFGGRRAGDTAPVGWWHFAAAGDGAGG